MGDLIDFGGDAGSHFIGGLGTNSAVFTMPRTRGLKVESVVATVDNTSGAASIAKLTIRDSAGAVIATTAQSSSFAAGATGTATFALRLGGEGTQQAGPYPPSTQLDYAEPAAGTLTITATTAATANTWIVGNPITLDGSTRIMVECFIALATSNHDAVAELYLDGADVSRICQIGVDFGGATFVSHSLYGVAQVTPAAGTHTLEVRAWKDAGSTGTFTNPTPFPFNIFPPSFYRVTAV